jgi:hypothetical protein
LSTIAPLTEFFRKSVPRRAGSESDRMTFVIIEGGNRVAGVVGQT